MKVKKIPLALIKLVLKIDLNAAKSVILLIFTRKFKFKDNNSCINKDTSTSNYHNIQCGKNEVEEQVMPP